MIALVVSAAGERCHSSQARVGWVEKTFPPLGWCCFPKNPGIRKEVEEYTDLIEQIHKRQKGSPSSSSSTMTPPQTTMPTGDVEMGVRHEKRKKRRQE